MKFRFSEILRAKNMESDLLNFGTQEYGILTAFRPKNVE